MDAPIPCIVGPTGSGKTRAAVALAQRTRAVILSADARQVYRGLDVATGKEGDAGESRIPGLGTVPARWVHGVPQIGLDLAGPHERFTAARWAGFARRAIVALRGSEVPVLVVGGTGLWVEALVRGFEFPDTDPRARHAAAIAVPSTVAPWRRHVRRAEIALLGVRPVARAPPWEFRVLGIDPPRPILRSAIESRIRSWFESGRLVDEVRGLLAEGPSLDPNALTAIGYSEARDVLNGRMKQQEALHSAVRRTWAFTRRQRTYFRNRLPETAWVESPEAAITALSGPYVHA